MKNILIITFAFINFSNVISEFQMLQTHLLFRHGNRTPTDTFPTDPYKEDTWSVGFGRLTNVGMKYAYILGLDIKNRYVNDLKLIPEKYDRKLVRILSTASNRTIETAETVLSALFKPVGDQIWNENLNWFPIPVNYSPKDKDTLLRPFDPPCPALNKIIATIKHSDEWLKEAEKNTDFFTFLSEKTGEHVNLNRITSIFQALTIEKSYGRKLPEWADEQVMQTLENLCNFVITLKYSYNTTEYRRLLTGVLLKNVYNNMKKVTTGIFPTPKMHIYSAHDTTIKAFFNTLGLPVNTNPPFTATLAIELYKSDQIYFVKLFYRNQTREFKEIFIPGCGDICPLKTFEKIYKDVMVEDRTRDCFKDVNEL